MESERPRNPHQPEGASTSEGAPAFTLTEKAIEMVKAVMRREGVVGYGLRVGVTGGGCSGFQYHLAFEEQPSDGDMVLDSGGVRIFIDQASRPHLQGVTLDYVTALHGAGFKFFNPKATHTCGCGSSFAT